MNLRLCLMIEICFKWKFHSLRIRLVRYLFGYVSAMLHFNSSCPLPKAKAFVWLVLRHRSHTRTVIVGVDKIKKRILASEIYRSCTLRRGRNFLQSTAIASAGLKAFEKWKQMRNKAEQQKKRGQRTIYLEGENSPTKEVWRNKFNIKDS